MRIIISPAKTMNYDDTTFDIKGLPTLLSKTELILNDLKQKSYNELKAIWNCNDTICQLNYDRIQSMNLTINTTPAIIAYTGLQYKYLAAHVLDDDSISYLQDHLRVLSGFYGCLKPLDGVVEYRLEMGSNYQINGCKNLYEFWGDSIYKEVIDESHIIINLASKEYSKCISQYLRSDDQFITINFLEEVDGKYKEKGTLAKMARGAMVRYMAIHKIDTLDKIKEFKEQGFAFDPVSSNETTYNFIKCSH